VYSKIPVAGGLSSSSAFVVAWIKFLNEIFRLELDNNEIALLAYKAEVEEFNEPGGKMDHFASATGGLTHINCKTLEIERFKPIDGLIIANTLIKKKTIATLQNKKEMLFNGLKLLSKYISVDLARLRLDEIEGLLQKIPKKYSKRVEGTIKIRDIVISARELLRKKFLEEERLGNLMNQHHYILREYFENSIPEIETIVSTALDLGALGCKITGSGQGGCIVIYSPSNQSKIVKAIKSKGFEAYPVQIDSGARRE
jgi:galactokinase